MKQMVQIVVSIIGLALAADAQSALQGSTQVVSRVAVPAVTAAAKTSNKKYLCTLESMSKGMGEKDKKEIWKKEVELKPGGEIKLIGVTKEEIAIEISSQNVDKFIDAHGNGHEINEDDSEVSILRVETKNGLNPTEENIRVSHGELIRNEKKTIGFKVRSEASGKEEVSFKKHRKTKKLHMKCHSL